MLQTAQTNVCLGSLAQGCLHYEMRVYIEKNRLVEQYHSLPCAALDATVLTARAAKQGTICSTGTVRSRWEKHKRVCTAPEIYSKTQRPEARLGVQESEPLDSLRTFQPPWPTIGSAAEPHALTPPLPLPWEQLLLSKHSQCCGKDTKATVKTTGEPGGRETQGDCTPDHPGGLGYL